MARIRLVSLVVSLALVVGVPGSAQDPQLPGGRFFDDNGNNHEPNIEAIAALNITSGCSAGGAAFCPGVPVNRAQMATFLARALGLDPLPNAFDDVNPKSPHAGNIAAIKAAGITFGCNAGGSAFCPGKPVTRAQMASFLARAFGLAPKTDGPFTDVAGVHARNINAIAAAGITLGCGGTLYCPMSSVIRAHMASFLARALDLEPVELAPQMKLAGSDVACAGASQACSGTSGNTVVDEFYIQEGWFYNLPYGAGDESRFASADFRLYIDGEEITNLVEPPTTNLSGTMITLGGYVISGLEAGDHTIVGEWWWDGELAFTSEIEVTASG